MTGQELINWIIGHNAQNLRVMLYDGKVLWDADEIAEYRDIEPNIKYIGKYYIVIQEVE